MLLLVGSCMGSDSGSIIQSKAERNQQAKFYFEEITGEKANLDNIRKILGNNKNQVFTGLALRVLVDDHTLRDAVAPETIKRYLQVNEVSEDLFIITCEILLGREKDEGIIKLLTEVGNDKERKEYTRICAFNLLLDVGIDEGFDFVSKVALENNTNNAGFALSVLARYRKFDVKDLKIKQLKGKFSEKQKVLFEMYEAKVATLEKDTVNLNK